MRQMRPPTISQWLWSPARTYLGATSLSVAQSRHHSGDSDPAKRTGQRQQDRTQCLLSRHEARGKEKKVPPAEFMKNPRRGPLELHEAGKKRDQLHDQPSRDSELREGVTRDFRKTKDDGKISGEEVLLYKTKLESGSIKGVSRLNRYHRTGGPSDKKVNDSFLAFRGNRLASDVFASSAFLEKVDDDYKLPDREEVPNPIKILEEKFKDYQREERHREDLLLSDEAKPPRIGEGTPNTTQDQTALPDIFGQSPFAKHQEELAQRGIDGSDVFISLVKKREQEFELQRRNRFQKCMQMFRTSPSSCEGDTLASWFALGEILAEKIEKEFLEKIRQEISEKLDLGKLQETSQGTSRFCPEPEPEPTEPTIPLSCLTDHLNLSPALSFIQLMRDLMPGTENADLQPWDPWSAAACRLPYGAHLVYFPLPTSASRLAADGADQDHVPPGFVLSPDGVKEGGRRLWAGGSLEFSHEWIEALRLKGPQSKSRVWECTEEIAKHEEKGSNGTIMVDLLRYYGRKDVGSHYRGKPWQIRELRQLAFVKGDGSKPGAEKRIIKFPGIATASFPIIATPTHLFQFSAMTWNAHFIHLADPKNALVHGPLLLSLMLRALSQVMRSSDDISGGEIMNISYRNIAPVKVGEQFRVCVRRPPSTAETLKIEKWDVWVEDNDCSLCVKASAEVVSRIHQGWKIRPWNAFLPTCLGEPATLEPEAKETAETPAASQYTNDEKICTRKEDQEFKEIGWTI